MNTADQHARDPSATARAPTGASWARLDALFDDALELPPAEREVWLDEACAGEPELRAEIGAMLAAHDRGSGILDRESPMPDLGALPALAGALDADGPVAAAFAAAISDRYVLDRELGRGGMATVFLAHERKHERRVVLKVLDPALAAIYGLERFAREVRIAARLSHPHIVPLLDSGEAAGMLFYVMPYMEGESLRDRMVARGVLPYSEALTLLREIAEGLAHAHDAGIVHRDLKPENVLCAGEHAYLLDFGVAKLLSSGTDGNLTRDGVTVGTPAYMAPEQRHGEADIDHRADVYAWGLLAHEMLTGRLPAAAVDGVPRRSSRGSSVPVLPRPLADVVARCLSTDPDDRPQRMAEVLHALRSLSTPVPATREPSLLVRRPRRTMLGVGAGIILLGTLLFRPDQPREAGSPSLAAGIAAPLAVAPLTNQTGDPALDSWGRMAADWITQGLQEVAVAPVVPWTSALGAITRAEEGGGADVVRLLRSETGAGAVVSGSYYLVGDSLSVRVELTDANTGRVLSAPPPVVVPRDSTAAATRLLRDRVMAVVAIVADGRISQVPGVEGHPPSFEAYRAFDDGMRRFLDQDYADAEPFFRDAHDRDSSFAIALLYAATAAWNQGKVSSADSLVKHLLADEAHLSGYHRAWSEQMSALIAGDRDRAREAARRASLAAPGSRASYFLASLALDTDRPRDALEALDQLDPNRGDMRGWSSYWTQRAHALHLLGRYEEEALAARTLRERFPQRQVAWVLEARALAALGRIPQLDSLVREASVLPASDYWSQGAVLVMAGEALRAHQDSPEAARFLETGAAWFERQLLAAPGDRRHRYWLASAYMDLERYEEAAAILEELSREFPDSFQYHGLAVLSATLAAPDGPVRALRDPLPHERGEHAMWRARLAAARGDRSAAARNFGEAARLGVDGLPWLHESAVPELLPLWNSGIPLPATISRPVAPVPSLMPR